MSSTGFVAVSTVLLVCLAFSGCRQSRSTEALYPSAAWYAEFRSSQSASRASPDGRRLLISDQRDPRSLILRVFNVDTQMEEHTLSRNAPCMRYTWNPDEKRIAFFCFSGKWRDLYLWNTETGKVDRIDVPRTLGATWIEWSPDGRYLAYWSTNEIPNGLDQYVLVDSQDLSVFRMPLSTSGSVSALSWAPDSRRFALLDTFERPHSLDVVDLSGRLLRRWNLPANLNATGLKWAPRGERLIMSFMEPARNRYWLGLFDTADGQFHRLTTLPFPPDSLLWATDEKSIYFQYDLPESRPIFLLHLDSKRVRSVRLPGFNEIRGITPDSKALLVEHSDSRPESWLRFWVRAQRSELLYSSASSSLPEIPGRTVWIPSLDQFRVPLIEYRSPKPLSPPAAVIHVHGGDHSGRDVPTWNPESQILLKNGVHYLAINFRGSSGYGTAFNEAGDTSTKTLDVLAAVEYAHNNLEVPYDRIAVYGESAGASLVVDAAHREPTHIGIAGLVAFRHLDNESILTSTNAGCPHRIVLVHPKYDFNSLAESRSLVAKALGSEATSQAVLREVEIEDEHQIVSPTSWPMIFEILLEELRRKPANVQR